MTDEEILAKYGGEYWKTAVTYDEEVACKRLVKAGLLEELKQQPQGLRLAVPGASEIAPFLLAGELVGTRRTLKFMPT